MRNPFVMAAMAMAALSAQAQIAVDAGTRRNAALDPQAKGFLGHRGARGQAGPRNPAGSKLQRQFYRAKHGTKGSLKEAIEWRATEHKAAGRL